MAKNTARNTPEGILDLRAFVICACSLIAAALSSLTAGIATAHAIPTDALFTGTLAGSAAFAATFIAVAVGLHALIKPD